MTDVQKIKVDGGEAVVLSARAYDSLLARLGDDAAEDRMVVRINSEVTGASLPLEVWEAMEKAPSPIGPLRGFRKLSQNALAKKAGITQAYLSELEAGKKRGGVDVLRKLADALGALVDDLAVS
jgi:hypothetical protein